MTDNASGATAPVHIKMRQPNGKDSSINVHYCDDGCVDIHFMRSSQGELLVRLPAHAAASLAAALSPRDGKDTLPPDWKQDQAETSRLPRKDTP